MTTSDRLKLAEAYKYNHQYILKLLPDPDKLELLAESMGYVFQPDVVADVRIWAKNCRYICELLRGENE